MPNHRMQFMQFLSFVRSFPFYRIEYISLLRFGNTINKYTSENRISPTLENTYKRKFETVFNHCSIYNIV